MKHPLELHTKRLYPTKTSWEYVEQDLILHLQEMATSCPQFKFVLHGQGLNNESLLLDFDGGHCDIESITFRESGFCMRVGDFFFFFGILFHCKRMHQDFLRKNWTSLFIRQGEWK